ncbi:MAG: hypothetical protein HYY37_02810 [Candidatus Aenigmarchaeota archaeon]|nr:hypothetical protein [Candidatus Aenigmarchaeota archaeon]
MLDVLEILSISLIIASALLLSFTLIKHFRGMQVPPYWMYFIMGFILLALSNFYERIADTPEIAVINPWIKLVASASLFFGAFEIFRMYESRVSVRLAQTNASAPPAKPVRKRKKKR